MPYLFNVDRRDGLQRAVNIELVHVSVKNGEIRENVSRMRASCIVPLYSTIYSTYFTYITVLPV